jgi:hypothetical protein
MAMPRLSTYLLCVTDGKLSQRATVGLQVATVCVWACMYLCFQDLHSVHEGPFYDQKSLNLVGSVCAKNHTSLVSEQK